MIILLVQSSSCFFNLIHKEIAQRASKSIWSKLLIHYDVEVCRVGLSHKCTDLLKTMRTTKIELQKQYIFLLHWLYSSHPITIFNITTKYMWSTCLTFSTQQQTFPYIKFMQNFGSSFDLYPLQIWFLNKYYTEICCLLSSKYFRI